MADDTADSSVAISRRIPAIALVLGVSLMVVAVLVERAEPLFMFGVAVLFGTLVVLMDDWRSG